MHWQNWAGLESADPRTVATPTSVDEVVEAVTTARRDGSTVKMVGTGHSFTAISAPARRDAPAAGDAGDHRRRPRRDDRHGVRRHPAEGAQRRARAARPVAAQHGRHRRADPRRRHLDRHPRHRRRRRRPRRPAGRAPAGHRHRRGPRRHARAERRRLRGRPRRARRARDPDHGDLRGRAAVPARGGRAADVVGRGARVLRRHGRGEPPLRHVLVPPHRPPADQAQHPARRRRLGGRAGLALPRLGRRRLPVQHGLRRPHRRRQPGARRDPADEPGLGARPVAPDLQRRRPPGLHLAAAGRLPRDGVRRPARGRARRAPRGPAGRRRVGLEDQLPGRDPGRPGRRHPALDGVRPRLLLPRLPHPPPLRLAHPRGVHWRRWSG